jgi:DNA mismatch repair protein MutL
LDDAQQGHPVPQFEPFPDRGARMHLASGNRPAETHLSSERDTVTAPASSETRPVAHSTGGHTGIQIHNRYVITENRAGVEVIDQHALHERILYEQLREKVLAGAVEKQRLLVPEPVRLTPAETAAVLETKEVLSQLGIDVEPFGGDTVLVSSYPAMLANFDPQEVLRQIAEPLLSGGKPPERRDLLDEMLHMISCKAAIKAGDKLTPEEISALLQQRQLYQDTHHCPHGRPTALVFTREELDKRFKRI